MGKRRRAPPPPPRAPEPPPAAADDSTQDWGAWIAAAVAAAVYSNSLQGDFVFDDTVAIVGNGDVWSDGPTDWLGILQHDFWGADLRSSGSHKSYRPLTTLSFRANYVVGGADVWGYHAVNVALHSAVSALVYAYARACMRQGRAAALAAALLFATHPVHTEAVAGVVGRAELLCALLALGGALLWAREFNVLGAACVALAFFAKETAVTVLPLLVAQRPSWGRLAALGAVGVALLAARHAIAVEESGEGFVLRGFRRLDNPIPFIEDALSRRLTVLYSHALYARLLVFPAWLSCDYSFDAVPAVRGLADARNAESAALLVALAALARYGAARPRALLALGWLALPFLPAAQIFFYPGTFVGERLLYLPSLGLCLLAGEAVERRPALRRAAWAAAAAMAARTLARNQDWRSQEALFDSALAVVPGSAKVLLNSGVNRWHERDLAEAERLYRAAEAVDDEFCQPDYWMGRVHLERQEYNEAMQRFQAALSCTEQEHDRYAREALEAMYREYLRLHPDSPDMMSNLGNILLLGGRRAEAEDWFRRGIELQPDNANFLSNYGYLLYQEGRCSDAVPLLERAVELAPGFELPASTLALCGGGGG